jgi:hypothetical protein
MDRVHHVRNLISAGKAILELAGEASPIVDEQFLSIANRQAEKGGFFQVIDRTSLEGDRRPDSIKHTPGHTLLPPNPYSNREMADTLGLIDLMLPGQVEDLMAVFSKEARSLRLFERIESTRDSPGGKFLFVSNHLNLPDQGFTMGFLHRVAAEQGFDRLEHHLIGVVGRLIGYFNLGQMNVVDGILRKVGSVLKTFPSSGSESMTEDEQEVLSLFRRACNNQTKQIFAEVMDFRDGQIICMAPSGEEDKFDPSMDIVRMRAFGDGTNELMIDACDKGAVVIPVFVDYGPEASIVRFLGERKVASRDGCHEVGRDIAAIGTYARAEAKQLHPGVERFNYPVTYG